MRLVIDLQGFQSIGSRMRGIGRYSLSLARAMARAPRGHDLVIAMNYAIPDIIEEGRAIFEPFLPPESIVVWSSLEAADALFPEQAWRRSAGGLLFEDAMARLKPDIVHISSLFEGWSGNVVSSIGAMPARHSSAITLYDLIPMQSPETYLADPWLRKWYEDRIEHLRRADLFLAISDHSREEGIELLGLDPERVVNISGSCSELFQPVSLELGERLAFNARYGINRPYLLYTGGFDSRKNVPALIRAFASLPEPIRSKHQLVIAGYAPPTEAVELESLREASGLRPDECIFAGYVPDNDLLVLYSYCRLYVFPSLREGFGLPVLEAMSCGAPVIGANRTSLPEVIGLKEAMFDPEDEREMRDCMVRALTDDDFRDRLHAHALVQARRYSWEACADRAWDAFEAEHERRRSKGLTKIVVDTTPSATTILAGLPEKYIASASEENQGEMWIEDIAKATDSGSAMLAKELANKASLAIVIDNVDTLRRAAEILQRRSCPVMIRGTTLEDLCAQAAAGPHLSIWIRDLAISAGKYFLLREPEPRTRTASFLHHWFEDAAEALDHVDPATDTEGWRPIIERSSGEPVRNQIILARQLTALEPAPAADDAGWMHAAQCMAWNLRLDRPSSHRLLVDMTELAKGDAGSGIQRVVRNIIRCFAMVDNVGFSIHPVYLDATGTFRHAHRHTFALLGIPADDVLSDEAVEWRPGDTFLGLDLSADALRNHPDVFARIKYRGIRMYFVVYDLIPLLRPDCVDTSAVPVFQHWYRSIAPLADGLICISRSVADELIDWLDQERPTRKRPLQIGHFPLGADLDGTVGPNEAGALPEELKGRKFVLMVGTIEPRKGYMQALDAFEDLWRQGSEIGLVIVGKRGWMVDTLIDRMHQHPEAGQRLFWYPRVADAVLQNLYERSEFVLCASEAEGFGLPLIEAAQHGVPVLARDIPVFREVAAKNARFFDGRTAGDLSSALCNMLSGDRELNTDEPSISWVSWPESASRLLALLREQKWYASYSGSDRRWFYATDDRLGTEVGLREGGVIRSTGRSGWLVQGPYVPVEKGRYRLRVHGRFGPGDGDISVELTAERGAITLFKQTICVGQTDRRAYHEEIVVLSRAVDDLEIRVHVTGSRNVEIRALELIPGNEGWQSRMQHWEAVANLATEYAKK